MAHLRIVPASSVDRGAVPTSEKKHAAGKFLLGVRLADPNSAHEALERIMANINFPKKYNEEDFEIATFRMGQPLYEEEMALYGKEVGNDLKAIEQVSFEIYVGTHVLDHIVLQKLVGRLLHVRRMANEHKNAQS